MPGHALSETPGTSAVLADPHSAAASPGRPAAPNILDLGFWMPEECPVLHSRSAVQGHTNTSAHRVSATCALTLQDDREAWHLYERAPRASCVCMAGGGRAETTARVGHVTRCAQGQGRIPNLEHASQGRQALLEEFVPLQALPLRVEGAAVLVLAVGYHIIHPLQLHLQGQAASARVVCLP